MCGLAGYSARQRPKTRRGRKLISETVECLAFDAEMRGDHSWGYAVPNGGRGQNLVVKGLGGITKTTLPTRVKSMLAHTRYATVGAVTIENSHPFVYKGCAVAHNGGIWNYDEVAAHLGRTFSVDSMALAYQIATHGDPSILEGYGAVHWSDGKHIYLCRMKGGELEAATIATPDGGSYLVWASTLADSTVDYLDALGVRVRRWPALREGRVYRVNGNQLVATSRRIDLSTETYRHSLGNASKRYDWRDIRDYMDQAYEDEPVDVSIATDGATRWQLDEHGSWRMRKVGTAVSREVVCASCGGETHETGFRSWPWECRRASCPEYMIPFCDETGEALK